MPKINLKTQAYNTIRQKIVTCEYAPGTFLNEELLTSELGLSRTPIRDALSRLEQEGLIEIKPKKGILVMPLSINTISMIFEVRQLYEPYILLNYGTSLSIHTCTSWRCCKNLDIVPWVVVKKSDKSLTYHTSCTNNTYIVLFLFHFPLSYIIYFI